MKKDDLRKSFPKGVMVIWALICLGGAIFVWQYSGTILTLYLNGNDFLFTKYIDLNYYKNLYWIDYGILFLLSASLIFLILCLYEIVLRIKLFK